MPPNNQQTGTEISVNLSHFLSTLVVVMLLEYWFDDDAFVEARLVGFSPNIIHPLQQPTLHYNNEVGNLFQDAHMRRSSTMKKEQISIVPTKNKFVSTQMKLSVQGNDVHNHVEKIQEVETPASNKGGTVIFSKRRNESKNDQTAPATKKAIAVMSFRPASSGHSLGIGHGNTPAPRLYDRPVQLHHAQQYLYVLLQYQDFSFMDIIA